MRDICDSILRKPAGNDGPASYWPKDEQMTCLIAAYKKWSSHGSVWSAAAPKVCTQIIQNTVRATVDLNLINSSRRS